MCVRKKEEEEIFGYTEIELNCCSGREKEKEKKKKTTKLIFVLTRSKSVGFFPLSVVFKFRREKVHFFAVYNYMIHKKKADRFSRENFSGVFYAKIYVFFIL